MGIPAVVEEVRKHYIARALAPSYFEINNGLCEDFAKDVIKQLGGETGLGHPVFPLLLVGGENFMIGVDGDTSENDEWDWKLLHTHWRIGPPEGLSCSEVDRLDIGHHVWFTDGKRHYDAECPEGVESFFDLPLYRRAVVEALRLKGIPADDVCVFDVVPAPVCPVPNPS